MITVILAALSLVLSFLTLSAVGRLHIRMNEADRVDAQSHNVLLNRIENLTEANESALSCLVSCDAKLSEQ
jgi:hypothetical protein